MQTNISQYEKIFLRVTALWALTEAALGGILHALRIPFTGLLIGSMAVIYIGIMVHWQRNYKDIIKATVLVIIVKFSISPHTPLTAYFAVFTQGLLGYIFYRFVPVKKIASILLGISAMLLSSLQKLIIITVVFGERFWESIDQFSISIFSKFGFNTEPAMEMSISLIIVSIYVFIHFLGGTLAGIYAFKFPLWIEEYNYDFSKEEILQISVKESIKTKRKWYRKKLSKVFVLFLFISFMLTYIFPNNNNNLFFEVLYMIVRAIVIISLWIFIVTPFLSTILSRFLRNQRKIYFKPLNEITGILPVLKRIVIYCWKDTRSYKAHQRLKEFILRVIVITISMELENIHEVTD